MYIYIIIYFTFSEMNINIYNTFTISALENLMCYIIQTRIKSTYY